MSKAKTTGLKAVRGGKRPLRLVWAEAGTLAGNPANWRRHPPGQVRALRATMGEVGWAGALLYNETTQRLIDGHARQESVPPETPVPVLVGRWTETQERQILATLDPLAAMAAIDADALESLLAETDLEQPDMAELTAWLDEALEDAARAAEAAVGGQPPPRTRGERTAVFLVGHFKFEVARAEFDRWLSTLEAKVGNDPDRVIGEIKRRLKV